MGDSFAARQTNVIRSYFPSKQQAKAIHGPARGLSKCVRQRVQSLMMFITQSPQSDMQATKRLTMRRANQ